MEESRRDRNAHRTSGSSKLIVATIVTGVLAGIGAIGFHYLSDSLAEFLFAGGAAQEAPLLLPAVIIVSTVGLGLIGILLQLIPESRLGGVVEVLDALKNAGGFVPFRRILNVIFSGLVLGFGGSVG